MAVSNGTPTNTRALIDATFVASVALPNAANTVNTSGFDLVQATPYPVTERFLVQVATTQSTGANTKNINVTIQDSADNITFAAIATLGATVIAGNAANFPAATANYALPPGTRRYVRASALGEANGGNAADGTLTCQFLF